MWKKTKRSKKKKKKKKKRKRGRKVFPVCFYISSVPHWICLLFSLFFTCSHVYLFSMFFPRTDNIRLKKHVCKTWDMPIFKIEWPDRAKGKWHSNFESML